ncbi:MAG: arginine--tRNA ligase [Candidatus Micrarchaeaceae archaeon]
MDQIGSPRKELDGWFSEAIKSAIEKAYPGSGISTLQVNNSISIPKSGFGDISSNIAIRLSKFAKKKPSEIASEIIKNIEKGRFVSEIREDAGYINANINEVAYSKAVIESVGRDGDRYGRSSIGNGEKVIVEYPSINPNKPCVVSHLRNALIGDSISNILSFCSYKVEREDYIDNLGLQMAETLWGWKNLSDKPDKKFDQWLGEQYVIVNRRLEAGGEEMKGQVHSILRTIENTDTEESKMLRGIAERCIKAQRETLFKYGIYHDVLIWEGDIVKARLLEKALEIGFEKGIFERPTEGKYAGCVVVRLEKIAKFAKELEGSREDSKVIIRSNGAATYIAKDFAFHLWKFGLLNSEFHYKEFMDQPNGRALFTTAPDGNTMGFGNVKKAINVIAVQQSYEQRIIKVLFSLIGRDDIADNLVHLSYGMVNLEGITLSTRKGTWMGKGRDYTADVLLEEAVAKALDATKRSGKLSDDSKAGQISEAIGIAAIRFEFLRMSPKKPMVFSWNDALNFEGNSGPYCMYSYTRAGKVLKKGGYASRSIDSGIYGKVTRGDDFELVKIIGSADKAVEEAAGEYSPDVIADYIIKLTTAFNRFYESMQVLNSDAKEFRMELIHAYMITLSNMLALLGIRTVDEM